LRQWIWQFSEPWSCRIGLLLRRFVGFEHTFFSGKAADVFDGIAAGLVITKPAGRL